MGKDGKKQLTTAEDRQDIIIRKLKDVILERQNGTLSCEVMYRNGLICEIRHRERETVIR